MKLTSNILYLPTEAQELVIPIQKFKTKKPIGAYRRQIDGGKIFEFCAKSRKITETVFDADSLTIHSDYKGEIKRVKKQAIDIKPGKVYIEALNLKSAILRFAKGKYIVHSLSPMDIQNLETNVYTK